MSSEKIPHAVAAKGFTLGADNYAKARPSYPAAAVEYIQTIVTPGAKVLDLAAGTGIMTKLLVQAGYSVTAVEPVANMRAKLKFDLPDIPALEGTSWNIPVESESQDAVIVAQAFHWFDDIQSLREIHRVLKPGGKLLLIWNMESRRSAWVGKLRDVYEGYDEAAPQYRKGRWRQVFETDDAKALYKLPLEQVQFTNDYLASRDDVIRRVFSKSYIAVISDDEKTKLREKFINECLIPEHGFEPNGDGYVLYPHDTDLVWAPKI